MKTITLMAAVVLAASAAVRADVWDVSTTDDDDASNTDNELVHGGRQVHDLAAVAGVPDQDWYRVVSFAHSSHEVLIEGTTGDVGPGHRLDRVTAGGGFIQAGVPLAGGSSDSRSLRWINTTGATTTEFVRVSRAFCTGSCAASDQYAVRYYETTGSIMRFSNSGTQITQLLFENPTTYPINAAVFYWDGSGTLLLGPVPMAVPAKGQIFVNTWTIGGLVSGHITVAHDGRYGELNGLATVIEPANGFSFGYPMVPRID